jgi:hypothetical protein
MRICTALQIAIINAHIARFKRLSNRHFTIIQITFSLLYIKPIIRANELNENLGDILERVQRQNRFPTNYDSARTEHPNPIAIQPMQRLNPTPVVTMLKDHSHRVQARVHPAGDAIPKREQTTRQDLPPIKIHLLSVDPGQEIRLHDASGQTKLIQVDHPQTGLLLQVPRIVLPLHLQP